MTGSRTAQNIGIVSAAAFLQIIIQFLFQRVLAAAFGAGATNDALFGALALPTLFAAVITGWLSYVLVPELVASFHQEGEGPSAWRLASFVGLLTTLISLLASAWLFWGAASITEWLYGDMGPVQMGVTSRLLQVLSIQVVLTGLISWAQAIHHSRHQFLIPALGGIVGTGVTLALAYAYGRTGVIAIAWAINAGSVVSGLIHVLPLVRHLCRPTADYPKLWKLLGMMWPLLLGTAFMRIDPLVDRVLAAKLEPGSLSHINFAQRIIVALLAIGTSGLALIAFPQLAQRLSQEGRGGFYDHFALAFRRLILIVVPVAVGVSLFSVEIVRDLLQEGEFTAEDSSTVGLLIVALMGMFLGASSGELLSRGFFVLGDTRTPTLVGALSLAIGLALKVYWFEFIGIWGIACGVSFYFILSASVMAFMLAKQTSWQIFAGSQGHLLQALTASLLACGACYLVYAFGWGRSFVAAPVGGLGYGIALLAVRNPDALQLWELIRKRLTPKRV